MRQRKYPHEINETAVTNIKSWLDANLSPRGLKYKHHEKAARHYFATMPEQKRMELRRVRAEKIRIAWQTQRRADAQELSENISLGSLKSMPDRKYYTILNDAHLAGIKPGRPFIHVCIHRAHIRYIRRLKHMEDIQPILAGHVCLNRRKIQKTYSKKKDVWILYTTFSGKRHHVADIFGMDLTDFPESYIHEYVRPADYRGPGRPIKKKPRNPPKKRRCIRKTVKAD